MQRINSWDTYDLAMQKSCNAFAEEYRQFISENKTEREFTDSAVNMVEKEGFVELGRAIEEGRKL